MNAIIGSNKDCVNRRPFFRYTVVQALRRGTRMGHTEIPKKRGSKDTMKRMKMLATLLAAIAFALPAAGSIPPGRWLVGQQVPAGEYETNAQSGCYWERLSGFSGLVDVLANDIYLAAGRQVVSISSSDAGFYSSSDCGTWTRRTGFSTTAGSVISPATDPGTIELNRQMYRAKSGLH